MDVSRTCANRTLRESSVNHLRSAPSPRSGPRRLICVGEHVTCPVVTCQAVPSTRRPPPLVIRATIWPPAAGGMLHPVQSSSRLFLDRTSPPHITFSEYYSVNIEPWVYTLYCWSGMAQWWLLVTPIQWLPKIITLPKIYNVKQKGHGQNTILREFNCRPSSSSILTHRNTLHQTYRNIYITSMTTAPSQQKHRVKTEN